MKITFLLVPLFGLVVCFAGYFWANHKPYGDAEILWSKIVQGGTGEGLELSYHVGGRPLDVQTEFFPAAKKLCKQIAEVTILAATKALDEKPADFFQITFHYGDFFHYARFVVENGKVNCEALYDGQGATHAGSVPKGT